MSADELGNDHFDEVLRGALRGRTTPAAGIDLAAEAMARAQVYAAQDVKLARLARLRRWMRMATFAAAALIAVTVAIGYRYWPADVSTADATSVTDTTSATTSASTIDWTTVGIALFVLTVVAVVLASVMTPERRELRLNPV